MSIKSKTRRDKRPVFISPPIIQTKSLMSKLPTVDMAAVSPSACNGFSFDPPVSLLPNRKQHGKARSFYRRSARKEWKHSERLRIFAHSNTKLSTAKEKTKSQKSHRSRARKRAKERAAKAALNTPLGKDVHTVAATTIQHVEAAQIVEAAKAIEPSKTVEPDETVASVLTVEPPEQVETAETVASVHIVDTAEAARVFEDKAVEDVNFFEDIKGSKPDESPVDTPQTPPQNVLPATPDDDDLDSRLLQASHNASRMEHQARERAALERAARELMSFSPKTPLRLRLPLPQSRSQPNKATVYVPGNRLPYPKKRSSPNLSVQRDQDIKDSSDGKDGIDGKDSSDNNDRDSSDDNGYTGSDKEGTGSFLERMTKRAKSSPSRSVSRSVSRSASPLAGLSSPAEPSPAVSSPAVPSPAPNETSTKKTVGEDVKEKSQDGAGNLDNLAVKQPYHIQPTAVFKTVDTKTTTTTYSSSVQVKRKGDFLHVYRRTVIPPAV
ncbi:hypothetical protein SBRCBS47491_000864 [Sporothrix bragantina]|uniref:Uncharacterized protein n=1 Tax=Sporothrix bragantina TaxID=671064 RepID=A0ABP0ATV7_9PEZI